jgi:putative SOS response-associated peptidase YedK
MCGRFSFVVDKKKVEKALPSVKLDKPLLANYNLAPTQKAYIVTNKEHYHIQEMAWGLIPGWSKDGKNSGALINARMETLLEKPSFKEPFQNKRCLVLADSFYEWRTLGRTKIPYRILPKNEADMLIFAGIWDEWRGQKTFSIITTEPNAEMALLHTRMPVILRGYADCDKWLGNTDIAELYTMCVKPPDNLLKTYRVSDKINSVKYAASDVHREVPEDLTLF